jgi:hypothetical protein
MWGSFQELLNAVIHMLFLPQFTCNYHKEPPQESDILFLFEDEQRNYHRKIYNNDQTLVYLS